MARAARKLSGIALCSAVTLLVLGAYLRAEIVRRLSGRGDGVVVRYRLTVVQVTFPFFAPVLLLTGLEGLDAWRSGLAWWPSFAWHELTGLAGACVLIAILTRAGRAAITLTPDSAVVVVRGWRTRVIPWPLIASVTVAGDFPGVRHVVLTAVSGKRISLSAPVSCLDPRFTEKVEAIRAYWIAGRHLPAYEPPLR